MTGRRSTIPAVRRRLHELLAARPGLKHAQVARGHPGRELSNLLVLVGRADTPEQDAAALGQRGRDERYSVDVIFDVTDPELDPDEVEDVAFGLLGELEDLLAGDPGLSGVFPDGNGHAELDGIDIDTITVEDNRAVQFHTVIVARVGVWTRLP